MSVLKQIVNRLNTNSARIVATLAAIAILAGGFVALSDPDSKGGSRLATRGPGESLAPGPGESPTAIIDAPTSSPGAGSRARRRATAAVKGAQTSVPIGGTIKLGVPVPQGPTSQVASSPPPESDLAAIAKAMVEEINATGGFAKRSIDASVRVMMGASRGDASAAIQNQNQMCTTLTEDDKVFMVLSFANAIYALDCYKKHETPYFAEVVGVDETEHRKLAPWILPPLTPNTTKIARLFPSAMKDQGFLTQKMGILVLELPGFRKAADEILIPGVEDRGGKVIERAYMPVAVQEAAAQTSSAVTRFMLAGVDRVILWAPGGLVWQIFAREAETYTYRPKYAITTLDQPELLSQAGPASVPPEQLPGSIGAGWSPRIDAIDRAFPPNEREKACWSVINRRMKTNFSERQQSKLNGQFALALCEMFYATREALAPAATSPQLTRTQVSDLVYGVGSKHTSISLPPVRFRKESVDASELYAPLTYFPDCPCYKYVSDWVRMPSD